MKIVSKAELMRMPRGTLFAGYGEGPWPEGPHSIFLSAQPNGDEEPFDFYYAAIDSPQWHDSSQLFDRRSEMEKSGVEYPLDLATSREGLYDDTTRYLVWDISDVASIVAQTAWFDANQGEWQPTSRYRVLKADGSLRFETDAEDAHQMARPGDTVVRLWERHSGEWRTETREDAVLQFNALPEGAREAMIGRTLPDDKL